MLGLLPIFEVSRSLATVSENGLSNSFRRRVETAIKALREGEIVVLVKDANEGTTGSMIFSAEHVTPSKVNTLAEEARGLVCLSLDEEHADRLGLESMVESGDCGPDTDFTVSIDARENTTTGISAFDRSETIERAVDPSSGPEDFERPGHIFPLLAEPGGVLGRPGHSEAVQDLCDFAGLKGAGVFCKVMGPDGTIADFSHLQELASEGGYPLLSINDLARYCRSEKNLVEEVADATIPTQFGEFQAIAYRSTLRNREHVVLTHGEPMSSETPLVRLHSQCITGDIFGSKRCDCGEQLQESMRIIAEEGEGIVLYLTQEGRGIGLANKIKAYELQEKGMDTVEANSALGFEADPRQYDTGAEILRDLGLGKLRLLTNNPRKISELNEYGLDVVERIPLEICPNEQNRDYLETKRDKMGHMFQELKPSAS